MQAYNAQLDMENKYYIENKELTIKNTQLNYENMYLKDEMKVTKWLSDLITDGIDPKRMMQHWGEALVK